MAYQNTASQSDTLNGDLPFARKVLNLISSGIEGFANFMASTSVARSRMARVERLEAMSDEQLAKVGLRRENIVRHVFQDF